MLRSGVQAVVSPAHWKGFIGNLVLLVHVATLEEGMLAVGVLLFFACRLTQFVP